MEPWTRPTSELERAITVETSRDSRLLTITASTLSSDEAQYLVRLSYEAPATEVVNNARERVDQLLAAAQREHVEWESAYEAARADLSAFDSRVDLFAMEARLGKLQGQLVQAEARLRSLAQNTIPADEAR